MNQTLSDHRAGSVRDYLVQQGVATASVSPQVSATVRRWPPTITLQVDSRTGRVELVVSGEAIGNSITVTTGSLR